MKYKIKSFLDDVLKDGKFISDIVLSNNFEQYQSDTVLCYAVERAFINIGEALNRIRQINPDIEKNIHYFSKIIGLRNRLTHGYDSINNEMIWDIANKSIPLLVEEVHSVLESLDGMVLDEDDT